MNSFIKNFIENNINLIEDNEWEHVFLNWYNLAEDIWPDDDVFEEFVTILKDVGVSPDLNEIESVLYDEIQWLFQNWMKDKRFEVEGMRHIGCASISDALHSHLGYSYSEVKDIIRKVAESLNLTYTDYYGGGYTW